MSIEEFCHPVQSGYSEGTPPRVRLPQPPSFNGTAPCCSSLREIRNASSGATGAVKHVLASSTSTTANASVLGEVAGARDRSAQSKFITQPVLAGRVKHVWSPLRKLMTGSGLPRKKFAVVRSAKQSGTGGRLSLGSSGLSRDRKSTRLNSSHSQISYAVFCLKKKKNKSQTSEY